MVIFLKGKLLFFLDGNSQNFDINNLCCISRNKLKVMNKNHLIYDDANSINTGCLVADVFLKV